MNGLQRGMAVIGWCALAGVASGCATGGSSAGEPAHPAAAAEDTVPDEAVVDVALEKGIDPEPVVEKKHEAERRVEELGAEAEREFREMFGSDPLGLARNPENAAKYEIPLQMNEQVEAWIDYFQNVIPDRFALYLTRAGKYENMIRRKLRLAGLPEDLLYLSLIESGMNPNAYSRAHAVGLWQFISSTGRIYDLENSFWLDERRDPVKATDAAIGYLSDLYDQFGSWYLAAAAYNGGPGRIRRGLAATGGSTFWDLARGSTLRAETRNYVPKLIAAAIIARDPARYGFGHVRPEEPLRYDDAEVPDATSLDVIAEAAGVDEDEVRALNPQFVRGVTPPDRRAAIKLPEGTGEAFRVAYAEIPASERVSWLVHRVTRGETLGRIAGRYGTSVSAIRAANGNVNPRRLQIGQRLVIPRAGGARVASASASSSRPEGPVTVVVRRGDTLWSIARRYEVTPSELIAWNDLPSTMIRPGQRIRIRR